MHIRAKNKALKSKEQSVELRDRIVSSHTSGEEFRKFDVEKYYLKQFNIRLEHKT